MKKSCIFFSWRYLIGWTAETQKHEKQEYIAECTACMFTKLITFWQTERDKNRALDHLVQRVKMWHNCKMCVWILLSLHFWCLRFSFPGEYCNLVHYRVSQKIANRILGPKFIALKILWTTFFWATLHLFFNLFYFILTSWLLSSHFCCVHL